MRHPFITDKKYKFGGLFLLVFIGLAYWASDGNYEFPNVFTGIMIAITSVAYFKLKR